MVSGIFILNKNEISQTIIHDPTRLISNTNITRFFFQLSDCSLLYSFSGINQACWKLDNDLVNWRSVLLFEK